MYGGTMRDSKDLSRKNLILDFWFAMCHCHDPYLYLNNLPTTWNGMATNQNSCDNSNVNYGWGFPTPSQHPTSILRDFFLETDIQNTHPMRVGLLQRGVLAADRTKAVKLSSIKLLVLKIISMDQMRHETWEHETWNKNRTRAGLLPAGQALTDMYVRKELQKYIVAAAV